MKIVINPFRRLKELVDARKPVSREAVRALMRAEWARAAQDGSLLFDRVDGASAISKTPKDFISALRSGFQEASRLQRQ
ncbi:MAG: hypothetical protein QXR53_01445 [Candidatus Norongarragalinales archaeon]